MKGEPDQTMSLVLLGIVLLATSGADAIVTFNDSSVLDESDFFQRSSVPVVGLCRDTCHIYASVAPEAQKIAENLLIQTSKGFVSIATVAGYKNETKGTKLPLEVKNTPTLTITNANANLISGHIVIYVVNHNGAYFDVAEVYEADYLDRRPSFARVITVMSARPFTLKQSNYMSMGVKAKLAGFDTLGSPTCEWVYSLEWLPFPGFEMTVIGPIISLLYDIDQFHNPAGELTAETLFSDTHYMEQNGFVASAGWHGCNGRLPYQSSLYEDYLGMMQKLVDLSYAQDVTFNVQTNVKAENALTVKDSQGKIIASFHDCQDSKEVMSVKDFRLDFEWTPQANSHYLVRYNSTAKPIY